MATIHKDSIVDVELTSGTIHRSFLHHSIGKNDSDGDYFGVRVFKNGAPVDLTNVSVQGHFNPPVGAPILLNAGNYISGNVATVRVPQACYNYEGPFSLAIKLVAVNETVTVRIIDGMVDNTYVEGSVAPTGTVPTYQEVLAEYDRMVEATATANAAAQTAINTANTAAANCAAIVAAPYSNSATYAVGSYCTKDGKMYECTTPITTAEEWNAGHWTETKVGPEVSGQKNALDYVRISTGNDIELITGNKALVFQYGQYRVFSDNTVSDLTTPITNTSTAKRMACAKCACVPGDKFTIKARGKATSAGAYGFFDSDYKGIYRGGIATLYEGTVTAPENAAWFAVNNDIVDNPEDFYAYKGESLISKFNELDASAYKKMGLLNSSDDLNNIKTPGWYYWTASHVPANYPVLTGYFMQVFYRTDSNVVQIAYPILAQTSIAFRQFRDEAWTEWKKIAFKSDISEAIEPIDNKIRKLNNNVFYPYTDFANGNINASTGQNSSNKHPLRSGYIPIDEFVSVNVSGNDGQGNDYGYQLFTYDKNYAFIGLVGYFEGVEKTRENVLTAYPNTKYIRIKITGGDSGTDLDVENLDDYGYEGYTRISQESISRNSESESDSVNVMSLIESNKDEDGHYTESFNIEFNLQDTPSILTITAQYTGEAPTIRVYDKNASTNVTLWSSPYYDFGGTREPTRKSWRIPPASAVYTKCRVTFTIPEGTTADIRDAILKPDQRNRYNDLGIKYHGHAGLIAPANTVESFQIGAEIGYNSMITIPKFCTDGTGVCFHDDSTISGDLCWIDGTAITGSDDKAISEYSYSEITSNFRIKSTQWGTLHVPTLDEYFRVCSLTGMNPIMSVHSSGFGMSWADGFAEIKRLAKKWNVLHKLGIKSGNGNIQSAARNVFGTNIDCYIFLSGQSHAPYDQLTIAKEAGFVDSSATDLSECEYKLVSEYFYTQTVPGATYYTETMASIATELARGFAISVAETDKISGAEMNRLIDAGVTEFTVDSHISMGLDW